MTTAFGWDTSISGGCFLGDYSAEGVFGEYIYVMPRHKLVIVKLSYWEEAWVAEKAKAFFNALGEHAD